MDFIGKYNYALQNIPPPGCGNGTHSAILGAANYGVFAGLDADRIFQDIRASIPQGKRRVGDIEIQDAINKALKDHNGKTFIPRTPPKPIVDNGKRALKQIISQSIYSDEDIWESSPIRLLDDPEHDPILFLKTRYRADDFLFIGEHDEPGILGQNIRTVKEWIAYFEAGGKTAPFIIINPLTGKEGLTKDGKPSLRCGNTVKTYLNYLAEFDNISMIEQLKFWSSAKLPIVALIHSGGKSIHAWVDVQKRAKVESSEDWQTHIRGYLHDRLLAPLGVDAACSNPARLSRLPGHYREEKGQYQRLLWLSAEGRHIS